MTVPIGFGPVSAMYGDGADPSAEPFPGGYFLQHADRSSLDSVNAHTSDLALPDVSAVLEPMRNMLQARGIVVRGETVERVDDLQVVRFDLVMPGDGGVPPRCARAYAVWYPDHLWLVDCVWRPEFASKTIGACLDTVTAPRMDDDSGHEGRPPDVGGPESLLLVGGPDRIRLPIPAGIVPIAHDGIPTQERIRVGFTDISMIAQPTALIEIEARGGLPQPAAAELRPFAAAMGRSAGLDFTARLASDSEGRTSVVLEGSSSGTIHRWIFVWYASDVLFARCRFAPEDTRVADGCFSIMGVEATNQE